MPYIKPEVIAEAKKMDLLTYLQNYEPDEIVKVARGTYCTKEHDSLRISNGKWNWFSQGIGGKSALDYLIKVKGIKFLDAIEMILGKSSARPPVYVAYTKDEESNKLLLPLRSLTNEKAIAYLMCRGIDKEIIQECIDHDLIYESKHRDPVSRRLFTNVAFVGLDEEKTIKYVALRGLDSDFIGEATGSDKHYSFSLEASSGSESVHLFESAIDLLSYATMMKLDGNDYKKQNLLSLAGIYQPKKIIEESSVPVALVHFLEEHTEIKRIILRLDNDPSGRATTKAIQTVIDKKYLCESIPAKLGKDYNDELCIRFDLQITQKRKSYSKELMR